MASLTQRPRASDRGRRSLLSPESFFCLWIVFGLGLFSLQWSRLFAPVRSDTAILLAIGFAIFAWRTLVTVRHRDDAPCGPGAPAPWTTLLATAYFFAAFILNGGIPIVQVLQGSPYDLYSFGVPGLHVAFLTWTSHLALRQFAALLNQRGWRPASNFIWLLALLSSMASRSALSFVMFACVCILIQSRRLRLRIASGIIASLIAFFVVFGQFGNARLAFQIEQETGQTGSTTAITNVARASANFYDTGLPAWTLWPYMYVASPIANLNASFEMSGAGLCGSECNLSGLVAYELLPSSIGDPLGALIGAEPVDPRSFLVARDLTATTAFGSAVAYAGMLGAVLVLMELLLLTLLVSRAFRGSRHSIEANAILSTILFFSFFENMVAYAALSLLLVWPALGLIRERQVRRSERYPRRGTARLPAAR